MLVKDNEIKLSKSSSGGRFWYTSKKAGADGGAGDGQGSGDGNGDDKGGKKEDDNDDDDDNDGDGDDKKPAVPLYKYRNLKDKFNKMSAEIEKLTKARTKEEEEKLKNDGKLQELLSAKEKDLESLKDQLEQFKGKSRQTKINMLVREAVLQAAPRDIDVVMPLIKVSDLEIDEDEDGEITGIKGLKKIIDNLKKEKDYLFGESKKNDNKDDDENNRQGAGDINSLEAEYRTLLAKDNLTIAEQNQLREVTKKLKELRAEAAKKK